MLLIATFRCWGAYASDIGGYPARRFMVTLAIASDGGRRSFFLASRSAFPPKQ